MTYQNDIDLHIRIESEYGTEYVPLGFYDNNWCHMDGAYMTYDLLTYSEDYSQVISEIDKLAFLGGGEYTLPDGTKLNVDIIDY